MFEKGPNPQAWGSIRMHGEAKNMTHQQAIEYFFDRIRGQILTALANWKRGEGLSLINH